jgi:hypothetical protein
MKAKVIAGGGEQLTGPTDLLGLATAGKSGHLVPALDQAPEQDVVPPGRGMTER